MNRENMATDKSRGREGGWEEGREGVREGGTERGRERGREVSWFNPLYVLYTGIYRNSLAPSDPK